MKKILIYGYGNPGRQDDALGLMLAEKTEKWAEKKGNNCINFDCNYHLNVEDALNIGDYEIVIFADASVEDIQEFTLTKVEPSARTEFSMHSIPAEFVLHLCHDLYEKFPVTYMLHIKGYQFDFLGTVTDKAKKNLSKAINFIIKALMDQENIHSFLDHYIDTDDIIPIGFSNVE